MENGDTPGTGSTDNGTAGGNVEVSDQDWLASRDAQRYTLQLIAGRQEATTERFINAHTGLRDQVRVVTVDGDDGTWHLVLLGDYPSRAQAMGSRPEGFAQDDVYARSFASVRGD
ncbi:MAG: SPOR domain-containing protein [Arhodomonas sp.]|nr:SPOR domain-containing protein [Arhodomonas sp.]